jgi:hypothetical protein
VSTSEPVAPTDPTASRLADLLQREEELRTTRYQLVALCRAEGWPWARIGAALGISKQGAVKTYGAAVERALVAARERLDREAARPSSPVAGPGLDVALDLLPAADVDDTLQAIASALAAQRGRRR